MYDLGAAIDADDVRPGTNLLVTGPPLSGKTALCYDILEHGSRAGESSIVVTNTDSAERVRADVPSLFDHAAPVGFVDCVTNHQGYGAIPDTELVQYVSSPEDMTGIGIKTSRWLEEFYRVRGVTRNRVLVRTVSTLLHYSDVQTVFRFLHVLTSRIEHADALGLFVLEVGSHDDETMNSISQLFDGMIRIDDDGSVTRRLP